MEYKIITSKKELIDYFKVPMELTVFDTETTGLKYNELILGIVYYDFIRVPVFVPTDYYFKEGLPISDIREVCNEYHPKLKGIAHNAKYDLGILNANGIADVPLVADTMVMVHTFNPELEQKLEKRVFLDFGVSKKTFEEVIGKKWKKIDWARDVKEGTITLKQLAEYACEDGYWEGEMYKKYLPLIEKEGTLKIHNKIELPLIPVLRDMYNYGVTIDKTILSDMGINIEKELKDLVNKIHTEAGCVFNINSGKQKAEILFDKLGLGSSKKTKAGARSTDSDTLKELALEGSVIAQLMCDYSTLQKLNSGYVQGIPLMVDGDGKLRCNFNSCGTRTRRFSSNNPNLQNQPNNKKFPVRSAFIAGPGRKLVGGDYGQIELRIMGHVANDEGFINAFNNNEDIHQRVGDDLGISRDAGKTINFGIVYGLGAKSLAARLGLTEMKAQKIIDGYLSKYKGFYNWKNKTIDFCKRNGYVKNLFGGVRKLSNINNQNTYLRSSDERRAVNTPIQGGAADLIKLAMIKIHNAFIERNLDAQLILQVHDELIIDCAEESACEVFDLMVECMTTVVKLTVPLEVDGKIMDNWAQLKDKNFKSQYEELKNGTLKSTHKVNESMYIQPWQLITLL